DQKLDEAKQPDLSGGPLAALLVELSAVPGRHAAVWAAIDPDVLELRHLAVDAIEREIIARQLVASVPNLALVGEFLAHVFNLGEVIRVADRARVEERLRKGDLRVVGAEMEALHGAIDVRVQVECPDERFGAAAWDAEDDEIELFGHFPQNLDVARVR